jgi:hypothetical protein
LFLAGRLTSQELNEAAYSASYAIRNPDDEQCDLLEDWAAAGAQGAIVRNLHRDLQRSMVKNSSYPHVYEASIPFWDRVKNKQYNDTMFFLLPYEVIQGELSKLGPAAIDELYCRSRKGLGLVISDWCKRVNLSDANEMGNVLGFGAWGDSAPINNRDSLYLVLFNVVTGTSNHKRHRFAAWSKRLTCNCGCKGRCTFEGVWGVMKWVADIMRIGFHPTHRHDGIPFKYSKRAGDASRAKLGEQKVPLLFKGGFVQFRGDWQFNKQVFNLTGWKGEGVDKRICWKCHANASDGPLSFKKTSKSALWRQTMVTNAAFLLGSVLEGSFLSIIFSFPGFVVSYFIADMMHCGELGVLQYLLGNTLFELFLEIGGLITKPSEAISDLLYLIRVSSKAVGFAKPPICDLTMPMIKVSGKAPKLKTKAAEGRYLLKAIFFMLDTLLPHEGDPHKETRYHCIRTMHEIYIEMEHWTDTSPVAIGRLGRQHMALYEELNMTSTDELLWRYYPKHHLWMHCVETQVGSIIYISRNNLN